MESQGPEQRIARIAANTCELDVVRSDDVLLRHRIVLNSLRAFYRDNHFAENALKIMRSSPRRGL